MELVKPSYFLAIKTTQFNCTNENFVQLYTLTYCGLVTPYGDRDLGQHFVSGNGLLPDGTKPLPEPNVDWWSVKSSDIHIRAISQEMLQPLVTEIHLKIIQNLIQISQGPMS